MKKAIILGEGGHARVIHSFIVNDYSKVEFYDRLAEMKIWENPEFFSEIDFFLGIGDNKARTSLFNRLKGLGLQLPVCRGPMSFIASCAKIGQGTFIGAGVIIMASAVIGENVIINTHSSVDHDCQLGDHTQLTAGITLGGATRIGTNCFLGVKVAILPGVAIGDNVQVMAGSLVTKTVSPNLIVGGYPSKTIKMVE